MKYSVIDISSNSVSLIVVDRETDNGEIVFKDRTALSLPHYMDGKRLSQRGLDRLTDCLNDGKETCRRLGADACYLISTAALRNIEGFDEVRAAVAEKTGLTVNLLDGETEAYCDYLANAGYAAYERAVLVDLGGKSIEICDLSATEKSAMRCLDFGLIDLHRKFVGKIQPDEEEADRIKKYVRGRFDKAELPGKDVYDTVVLVGATNLALYDIYADYADEEAGEVRRIRYKTFKKLVKKLVSGKNRARLIFDNAPEKLHLAGPAAIVLKVLFKRFGARNILVSDRGVKEGFLSAVLDGREKGLYYDFAAAATKGTPRDEPAAGKSVKPDKAAAGKKPDKKKAAGASQGKASPENKSKPPRSGRAAEPASAVEPAPDAGKGQAPAKKAAPAGRKAAARGKAAEAGKPEDKPADQVPGTPETENTAAGKV